MSPFCHDFRNVTLCNRTVCLLLFLRPFFSFFFYLVCHCSLIFPDTEHQIHISGDKRLFPLVIQFTLALLKFKKNITLADNTFQPKSRSRLINKVNCLIRQKPVIDISHRKTNCRLKCLVTNRNLMIILVSLPQPLQHIQSLRTRRLFNHNRLEPSLQRSIFLQVFAVFLPCSCTDYLKFSSCQCRFQNIGRIDRTLRATSTDYCMKFINEEENISTPHCLTDKSFHSLFKLAAVFGAGYHSGKVYCNDLFAKHRLRHTSLFNSRRKPFRNRCLTHSRLTYQARIILRSPAQNLNHTTDFLFPVKDRINLPILCHLIQILAVLV